MLCGSLLGGWVGQRVWLCYKRKQCAGLLAFFFFFGGYRHLTNYNELFDTLNEAGFVLDGFVQAWG